MANNLCEYEDDSLMVYSEFDDSQQIFSSKDAPELKDNLVKLSDDLENTYIGVYYWAKGELSDVEALKTAIGVRNASSKKAIDLKKKNTSTQKDIESLENDKKSISTVFKSKSDVDGLADKITTRETEIEY